VKNASVDTAQNRECWISGTYVVNSQCVTQYMSRTDGIPWEFSTLITSEYNYIRMFAYLATTYVYNLFECTDLLQLIVYN
jgi:hypothetical protein